MNPTQLFRKYIDIVNEANSCMDEKLDPVGKEDADVNNDGKANAQDKYLKHRRNVINKNLDEVAPKGWEGTVKAMKKHPEIDNPWALAHYIKGKGYKSHKESKSTEM